MSRVPEQLDPWRAVERTRRLEGSLPLHEFKRLAALLVDTQGTVEFQIVFFRGDKRRPCVRGWVKAKVGLSCQRCLQAVTKHLDSSFSLALVEGLDEAGNLPEEYEPLLVADGRVHPREIIEDELLLALPQIAAHGPDEICTTDTFLAQDRGQPDHESDAVRQAENPFSVLEQLKNKLH